jgi:hypothetical protein
MLLQKLRFFTNDNIDGPHGQLHGQRIKNFHHKVAEGAQRKEGPRIGKRGTTKGAKIREKKGGG